MFHNVLFPINLCTISCRVQFTKRLLDEFNFSLVKENNRHNITGKYNLQIISFSASVNHILNQTMEARMNLDSPYLSCGPRLVLRAAIDCNCFMHVLVDLKETKRDRCCNCTRLKKKINTKFIFIPAGSTGSDFTVESLTNGNLSQHVLSRIFMQLFKQ